MRIALDFDGTVTADRPLFAQFAMAAVQRGHIVAIVTMRPGPLNHPDNRDIAEFMATTGILQAVFTSGAQKADHHQADVWIDDMPAAIPSADSYHASRALQDAAAHPEF